jgi:hypothetical protein
MVEKKCRVDGKSEVNKSLGTFRRRLKAKFKIRLKTKDGKMN